MDDCLSGKLSCEFGFIGGTGECNETSFTHLFEGIPTFEGWHAERCRCRVSKLYCDILLSTYNFGYRGLGRSYGNWVWRSAVGDLTDWSSV